MMKVSSAYNVIGVALAVVVLIFSAFDFVTATFITQPSRNTPVYARSTATQLAFGIPSFLTPQAPKDDEDGKNKKKNKDGKKIEAKTEDEKSVGLKGLVQLVMAGAGAPFLGDFEGVDKETGKFMFSLEANNLVDENGQSKQTSMPYFENGWVDPADLEREEQRKKNGGGFKFPW